MKIKNEGLRYGALAALLASGMALGLAHAGQNATTVSVGGSIGGGSCTASADAVNLGNKSFTDFTGPMGSLELGAINFNVMCPAGTPFLIRMNGSWSQMLSFGAATLIFQPGMIAMNRPMLANTLIGPEGSGLMYNGIGTGTSETLPLTGMSLSLGMAPAPTNGVKAATVSGLFVLVY
jgi:hypothetical protein